MSSPSDSPALLVSSLASFTQKRDALASKLEVSILYGQGFMVLADSQGARDPITLVLGRFDRPGHYSVNSPQVFASLDITPDHLCGVSLYDPEQAARVMASCKADSHLSTLSNFRVRHIRAEQERRLANWREMVTFLESALAKLDAT